MEEPPSVVDEIKFNKWAPFYLISAWEEQGTTTPCCTVATTLPSSASTKGTIIKVMEGGRVLEVIVRLPLPFTDLSVLHRKLMKSSVLTDKIVT